MNDGTKVIFFQFVWHDRNLILLTEEGFFGRVNLFSYYSDFEPQESNLMFLHSAQYVILQISISE